MEEVWKDCCIYGDIYAVSNLGRVKNKRSNRIRKLTFCNKGYCRVMLKKTGCKSVFARVHRLVANAFIPNPGVKPQINHKNGVKSDNCVNNLEWCFGEDNIRHAFASGLVPSSSMPKKVVDNKNNIVYSSIRQASKLSGSKETTISNSANKKTKNIRWTYTD